MIVSKISIVGSKAVWRCGKQCWKVQYRILQKTPQVIMLENSYVSQFFFCAPSRGEKGIYERYKLEQETRSLVKMYW